MLEAPEVRMTSGKSVLVPAGGKIITSSQLPVSQPSS
jgi:hypothetical protein